jgi:DNA-binding Lrp family transcriptional regulator
MDELDRCLVNALLGGFPVSERPFAEVARDLGLEESEVIERLAHLRAEGVLTRFGPLYDAERLGGAVTLCAMQVPLSRFEEVAAAVNAFPEVAHNYQRRHALNMWFVLAAERPERIDATIARIEAATGLEVLNLPKLDEYFLELKLSA